MIKNDRQLMLQTAELLIEYLSENDNADVAISEYLSADDLQQCLNLTLDDESVSHDRIIDDIKQYLRYCTRTSHPHFMKQLFSGSTSAAIAGDWVTTVTNTAAHTYQVAPVATLMEETLITKLNELVGFESGDGIMVTGGSNANLVGIYCGLHKRWPDIKQEGFRGQQPVIYVSDQCHYSYEKAVFTLGIGTNNLRKVNTDEQNRIDPEALRLAIIEDLKLGKHPYCIGATSGTTVAGSFDPLEALADLADEFGLWLHVDAAWGGPVLFSETHKHLMRGVERADSVTWDAHKFMSLPLICSAILVREHGILESACSGGGQAYLFHEDENSDHNYGKKSLQCGRHVDSLKLWLDWRYKGTHGYRDQLDKSMQLAQYFVQQVNAHEQLEMILEPDYLNLFFRFVPDATIDATNRDQLNLDILTKMKENGSFYIDYATVKDQLGIRLVLVNNRIETSHLDSLLDEIVDIGNQT
ncbi:pyridoxal phosphate-dependent decarboxylase family protein [Leucothrix arctica]|uniref:Glutamate decarboxylase n=1 Tax=Leucothrix arctica TaxID=1481894 RepID=A0A317CCR4_9GAMM|nr:pyridoxal-dependent decarboxylase [Leucothrix arctica]PWQ93882.1 glutamate decarboxylase [Leucothrix arctica]